MPSSPFPFPHYGIRLISYLQLAPSALYPDKRLPSLHIPVLRLHLFPQPAMRLLLFSTSHSLRIILLLVGPVLLRFQQQLV